MNKIKEVCNNRYSTVMICKVLGVPRSTLYYKSIKRAEDPMIIEAVESSFTKSLKTYGQPRIKADLKLQDHNVSRLRIKRIMSAKNLVSCYNKARKPKINLPSNNDNHPNLLDRQFNYRKLREVIVSDTTYFDINGKWYYLCPLIDLHRREIVGYSVSAHRDQFMAVEAFYSTDFDLRETEIFHSDRGGEFKNHSIDKLLKAFGIKRSLSKKATPVDNAVIESFFQKIKIEFIDREVFTSIEDFKTKWSEYVFYFNNKRLHSSLGYSCPKDYIEKNKD